MVMVVTVMMRLHDGCQEEQRQQLEEERDAIAAQLRADNEDAAARLNAELDKLRAELAAVQRDRDQRLIIAQTDHQQVDQR